MTRLANRRRSAKKSLRKKNMRKSVKHTKRNNRKTRMSHKRHTRKQRGGKETYEERVTRKCIKKCIDDMLKGETSTEGQAFRLTKGVNMGKCISECQPGQEKYTAMEKKLEERKKKEELEGKH
jgi:hypothetical protein